MEVDSDNLTEGEENALKEFPSICGNLTEKQIDNNLKLNMKSTQCGNLDDDGVINQFLQSNEDISSIGLNDVMNNISDDDMFPNVVLNEKSDDDDDEFDLDKIKAEAIKFNDSLDEYQLNPTQISFKKEGSIDLNYSEGEISDECDNEPICENMLDDLDNIDITLQTQEIPHDISDLDEQNQVDRIPSSHGAYFDCNDQEDGNEDISTVMNDHNYMSQEVHKSTLNTFDEVRCTLVGYLNNDENKLSRQKVDEIVNELLEKLDAFKTKSPPENNNTRIECDRDENSEEFSLVVSENEAEDTNSKIEALRDSEPKLNNKGTLVIHKNNPLEIDSTKSNLAQEPEGNTDENTNQNNDKETHIDKECSEKSIASSNRILDSITKDQECQTEVGTVDEDVSPLTKISNYALNLMNACISLNTDITEDSLNEFIYKEFCKFKDIISTVKNNAICMDVSIQTEKSLSKKRLKRMNEKDKIRLLQSSSSSGESNSSSEEEGDNNSNRSIADTKSFQSRRSMSRMSGGEENVAQPTDVDSEYDDGLDLGKYLESEMCEVDEDYKVPSPIYPTDKDIESGGVHKTESVPSSMLKKPQLRKKAGSLKKEMPTSEENLNGNSSKKDTEDEENDIKEDDEDSEDREIDRLINLDNLEKKKLTATQYIYENGIKKKTRVVKKTKKLSDFDVTNEPLSDDSLSETGEEILTEKEFLERRNENLKKQLLNSSSSDSEIEDLNVDLKDISGNDDSSEENGRSSTLSVDKFLKNLDPADVVAEENKSYSVADDDEIPKEVAHDYSVGSTKEEDDIDQESHKSLKSAPSTVDDLDENSDCEILMDSPKKKQVRVKSLQKLLAEGQKRKKISIIDDDLISLSSDSETGTEECESEEPKSKKRYIKPMLRSDQLDGETRTAQKEETDRIKRLEKKNSLLTKIMKEHAGKSDKAGDSKELILDYCSESKTFIKVHEDIVKYLKRHQFEGIKFMYDSCYGSVNDLKKHSGSGCILAHCMGLGKTLQLIGLLHTVISYKELKTSKVLVLCPKSTVMNWSDEIQRWLGPINMKGLRVFTFNDTSDIHEKIRVLRDWSACGKGENKKAGCLLIGYEAFRTLVFFNSYKKRGSYNRAQSHVDELQKKINEYLLQSGADLVVCDEGHIIKNRKSAISTAVAEIKTKKRIVLTGTPIQNNLKEYYSMVNFIKPLFLGTEKEFANLYANPIKQGQHKDSSKRDIKIMQQRSFVLHKKLSKFVQRKEAALLKTFLPEKFEYVLFVPMTDVQMRLYEYILEAISQRGRTGSCLITDYTCLRKIWTHPKVLESAWINATQNKNKKDERKKKFTSEVLNDDDQPDDLLDTDKGVMSVTRDWWRSLLSKDDLESVMPSNKLRTMFEILRVCEELGEKCLIFSAFVAVLNVVEFFLKKLHQRDRHYMEELYGNSQSEKVSGSWINGEDYYRLDGKTPKTIRHQMVKSFNSPTNKRARLFLISAKAGGQGINLTGANRVIILDTSWNPSNDQQNIFRIFRLGQKRKCYIYRLLAMGTMEEKVYSRSVTKQAMSFRVVDEQQIDRHYSMAELAELYSLTKPDFSERPVPTIPQDNILANLLRNHPNLVYKYHEHDSLLENKVEQELSEQEKEDAWAAYERDMNNTLEPNALFGTGVDGIPGYYGPGMPNNFLPTLGFNSRNYPLNYSLAQANLGSNPLMGGYSYPSTSNPFLEMLNMYPNYPSLGQSSLMYGQSPTTMASAFNQNYLATLNNPAVASLLQAGSSHPLAALNSMSSFNNMNNIDKSQRSAASNPTSRSPLLPPFNSSSVAAFNTQQQQLANFSSKELYETAQRTVDNTFNASNNVVNGSSRLMSDLARSLASQAVPQQSPVTSVVSALPAPVTPSNSTRHSVNKTTHQQITKPSSTAIQSPAAVNIQTRTSPNSPSIPTSVIKKPDAMVTRPGPVSNEVSTKTPAKTPVTTAKSLNYASSPITVTKISTPTVSAASKSTADVRSVNMGILYPERNVPKEAGSSQSLNMGIVYPQTNSPKSTQKAVGTPATKAGSGMQIIATRGVPPASMNKQFEQLSPSISLTAVNPSTKTTTVPSSGIAHPQKVPVPKVIPPAANMHVNKVLSKSLPKVNLPKAKPFNPPRKFVSVNNTMRPTQSATINTMSNLGPTSTAGSRIKMTPSKAITTPIISSVQSGLSNKIYASPAHTANMLSKKIPSTVKVTMTPSPTALSTSATRSQTGQPNNRAKSGPAPRAGLTQLQQGTQNITKRIELNPTTLAAVKNSINSRPGQANSAAGVFFIAGDKTNTTSGISSPNNNSIGGSSGATITRVVQNRKRGTSTTTSGSPVTIAEIKRQKMSTQLQTVPRTAQNVSDSLKRVQSTRALTIVQSSALPQNQKVVNKDNTTEIVEID